MAGSRAIALAGGIPAGGPYSMAGGWPAGGIPTNTEGPAYVGPGDAVSGAYAWYGLRGYNRQVSAARVLAINVKRASDSATKDISILPTGALDMVTLRAFLSGTIGTVPILYDQTGNGCHLVQATTANQPTISLGAPVPMLTMLATTSPNMTATIPNIVQPYTMVAASSRIFNSLQADILSTTTNNAQIFSPNAANSARIQTSASAITATAIDNVFHSIIGVFNSTSSSLTVDGATTTGDAGTLATGTTLLAFASNTPTNFWNGSIFEMGIWPGFSTAQIAAMTANM